MTSEEILKALFIEGKTLQCQLPVHTGVHSVFVDNNKIYHNSVHDVGLCYYIKNILENPHLFSLPKVLFKDLKDGDKFTIETAPSIVYEKYNHEYKFCVARGRHTLYYICYDKEVFPL